MNLLNLFDIVNAVAAQKQSEQPTDNVVDVPATVQASQANGQPATIVVPVAAASEVEVLEDDHEDSLNIGDEVIIAGNVQYQGKTGRVVDFGRNKHFVIVDLYNFGKHSFHSSNVEHNDYADSEEEDANWRERDHGLFGNDERDENLDEGYVNFGAVYAEQLAQKVFDERPNFSTKGRADELVDYAYRFAVQDLGKSRARYEFNYDEDFLSDFVSAYAYLQGGEQGMAEGLEDTNVQDTIFDTVKRLFNKNEISDYSALEAIRQGIKHHFSKPGATVESAIDGILNILDKRRNKGDHYLELTRFKEALRQGVAHQLKKQGVAEGSSNVRYKAHPTKKTHVVVTQVPTGHKGIKVGDEIARSDIKGWKGFSAERKNKGVAEEVDTGEYDARKSVPSSKEKNDEVFRKHRERIKNLDKDKEQGVAEGEYDDPRWEPREPDMSRKVDWDIEAERNKPEEKSEPTTVTVRDADGKVVLTFPSTGGFYGDKRLAASKGFDTETGDYTMKWKRDTNEGNNWLDTPVSEEFDRIKKLAGLK